MKKIILLLLALLLCTACSQTPAIPEEPPLESASDAAEQAPAFPETEDHILLTLEAPLADGRTLMLETFGRQIDEYNWGVREVRVYDGQDLLQTVFAREAIALEWDYGSVLAEDFYDYTTCWRPEETMKVLDLNFDGNTDFGLFGWSPNNAIPYYYWQWNGEQYQFACTLQDVEVHPETGEVSSWYKVGGGILYQEDYYRPDEEGNLYLVRQERERYDFPNLDADRGGALETWVPREGVVIRPRPAGQDEDKLVLIRREIPVYEVHADNTVSHFTEIWELRDGHLQMTSRNAYVYDECALVKRPESAGRRPESWPASPDWRCGPGPARGGASRRCAWGGAAGGALPFPNSAPNPGPAFLPGRAPAGGGTGSGR